MINLFNIKDAKGALNMALVAALAGLVYWLYTKAKAQGAQADAQASATAQQNALVQNELNAAFLAGNSTAGGQGVNSQGVPSGANPLLPTYTAPSPVSLSNGSLGSNPVSQGVA